MPPRFTKEQLETIQQMTLQGQTSSAISKHLNLNIHRIACCVTRMRKSGKIPSLIECRGIESMHESYSLRVARTKHNIKFGKMTEFAKGLTEDEFRWIKNNLPEGLTVAEYMVNIIRDVIMEEADG